MQGIFVQNDIWELFISKIIEKKLYFNQGIQNDIQKFILTNKYDYEDALKILSDINNEK